MPPANTENLAPPHLHTLPQDIQREILKELASFRDLYALVLTHRAFDAVWRDNTNGVKRAIAHTQFSPWDEACALLEHQGSKQVDATVTADLEQLLANARYIDHREESYFEEDRWPTGYDDNRVLTSAERLRYRRAMYRIWQQLLRPSREFFMLPLRELLELKEVSTRLWGMPVAEGTRPKVPKGLPAKWRELGPRWHVTASECMVDRIEGLRGHEKEGSLVKRLCELGAGSDMYTVSVVLEEGQREAGELERIEEEWRERRAAGLR